MSTVPLSALPTNNKPCGGPDNVHDGCQMFLPFSNPDQVLCHRCQKLNAPGLSESDIKAIQVFGIYHLSSLYFITSSKALKACDMCGLTGNKITNPCGTCNRRMLEAQNQVDPIKEAARLARLAQVQKAFGIVKPPLADTTNHHPGPTTSAEQLSDIRSANKKGDWLILMQVRVDNKIDQRFGQFGLNHQSDDTLQYVLENAVNHINVTWTSRDGNYVSLSTKYCILSFKNNFRIATEATTLTVKGLYNFYLNRNDRTLALGDEKNKHTRGLAKGTYMFMEVVVEYAQYKKAVERFSVDDDDIEASGSKRKKNNASNEGSSKRLKSQAVILQSSFAPAVTYAATPSKPEHFVQFTTIECIIDPITGVATMEQSRSIKTGKIEMQPLAGVRMVDMGKSKDVFKMTILGGSGHFVAKTFFNVGQGRGQGLIVNERMLLHDLVRMHRLNVFLRQFEARALDTGTEISSFVVSEAAVIIVQSESGTPHLVEKFSGTIGGADNSPNQLASTMVAFTHFILQITACRLAFTDLQGSYDCERAGEVPRLVLFDPMTHSLSGNTGVGDHGAAGIEDTIDTHICSYTCRSMKLASLASLQMTFENEKDTLDNMDMDTSDEEGEDGKRDSMAGFILHRAAAAPGAESGDANAGAGSTEGEASNSGSGTSGGANSGEGEGGSAGGGEASGGGNSS
ncbi:hypothetical protein R3P38DRAFT_3192514 [Favolaschia claudopus]|uniref:Alpha-type protein kinase domain-containing protein n=1 Tax=Favolaschia claudopus TaxID=2862362 RepID=A0AAW0BL65_9AGAR